MVLVESDLNSEQVSFLRPIRSESCISALNLEASKQVVFIERVVLILGGLYMGTLLYLQKYELMVTAIYQDSLLQYQKTT